MNNRLHLYAQSFWHDPATIVGDTEALTAMIEVLQQALSNPPSTENHFETMANDGEGYRVRIFRIEDPDEFKKLRYAYTDDVAEDHRENTYIP